MLIVFKHSILTGLCSKATTKLEKKKKLGNDLKEICSKKSRGIGLKNFGLGNGLKEFGVPTSPNMPNMPNNEQHF